MARPGAPRAPGEPGRQPDTGPAASAGQLLSCEASGSGFRSSVAAPSNRGATPAVNGRAEVCACRATTRTASGLRSQRYEWQRGQIGACARLMDRQQPQTLKSWAWEQIHAPLASLRRRCSANFCLCICVFSENAPEVPGLCPVETTFFRPSRPAHPRTALAIRVGTLASPSQVAGSRATPGPLSDAGEENTRDASKVKSLGDGGPTEVNRRRGVHSAPGLVVS